MPPGSLSLMLLHKKFLIVAGKDGMLHKVEYKGLKVTKVTSLSIAHPATTMCFNSLYTKLAVGNSLVSNCVKLF